MRFAICLLLVCSGTALAGGVSVKSNSTGNKAAAYSWARISGVTPVLDDYDYEVDPTIGWVRMEAHAVTSKVFEAGGGDAKASSIVSSYTDLYDGAISCTAEAVNHVLADDDQYTSHSASKFASDVYRTYVATKDGKMKGSLSFKSIMRDASGNARAVGHMGPVTMTAELGKSKLVAVWDNVNTEWDVTGNYYTWAGGVAEEVNHPVNESFSYNFGGANLKTYSCSEKADDEEEFDANAMVNDGSTIMMLSRGVSQVVYGTGSPPHELYDEINIGAACSIEVE